MRWKWAADAALIKMYQKIEAQLTAPDRSTHLPLVLHAVPNGPDVPADEYGFSGFVSTSFTASQTGDHLLRFADPTGRAWRYEIYIIPTFDTDPNVNEITGTNDADSLYGGYGDDIIRGGEDSDELYGRWGRDQLFGGAGNDTLFGGAGADLLDGGAGFDQVSYINSPAGVIVSLSDLTAATDDVPTRTKPQSGGHAEGDILVSVEMLIGSHFADRLTGNAENNVLRGLGGADILDGGGGDNEANYFGSKKGVTVSLSDLTAATDDDPTRTNPQSGGDAEGDVLINIHHIYGSDHNDVLTGDDKDNIFWGRGGADSIDGRGGFDWVYYTTIDTPLSPPAFSNGFAGHRGHNDIPGVVIILASPGNARLQTRGNYSSVSLDPEENEARGDSLKNIEGVVGSRFRDLLYGGDGQSNHLVGGLRNYASYEGDLNFRSVKHGSAGNDISIKLVFTGTASTDGNGGIVSMGGFAGTVALNPEVTITAYKNGFTFGQAEDFYNNKLNASDPVRKLIRLWSDDGDEGFRMFADDHQIALSGGDSTTKAAASGPGFTLTAINVGAVGGRNQLGGIEFDYEQDVSGVRINTSPSQTANGDFYIIQIGPDGALLSEIKDALDRSSVTSGQLSMTVTQDTRIFVNSDVAAQPFFVLSGGGSGNDVLLGGDGIDWLDGRDDDNTLTGGDGADLFFLNRTGTGKTTVTDFDTSEGDRVRINTATGNEDTLAKLGLAVADNGAHANITSTDGSEVYMILENIDHALITDASFTTYFDIV